MTAACNLVSIRRSQQRAPAKLASRYSARERPACDLARSGASKPTDTWPVPRFEKLAPAATVIAGNDDAAKPLLARWKLLLRNSSPGRAKILGELHASGREAVTVGTNMPVHEAITYFTNNATRTP